MTPEAAALLDRTRIIETITRLFVGTDNRDWELVKSLFAPRVLFDMSSMGAGEPRQTTPEAIVSGWEQGLEPLQAIHHQAGNYLVTLEGASAEAFCYGIASHYLPNPTGRNTRTFVGSYEFGLERDEAAWRITRFKFTLKYVDGNTDLERS
jgi:hypothetical protein